MTVRELIARLQRLATLERELEEHPSTHRYRSFAPEAVVWVGDRDDPGHDKTEFQIDLCATRDDDGRPVSAKMIVIG